MTDMEKMCFSKASIDYITDLIKDDIAPATNRNHAISARDQVMIALRFYATGSMLLVTGHTHSVSKASVSRIVARVLEALCRRKDDFIKFPTIPNAKGEVRRGFYKIGRMPGVIRCINSTQLKIQAPSENEANFVNRKGFHSFNIQAVCDHKGPIGNEPDFANKDLDLVDLLAIEVTDGKETFFP
ncbi:putative nuclease HARBI1 [Lingula anatina]|uniref:Nuclease HARBI1 n=1 Tax=Lingula anatina TaxID=7574 RepID=A0A1S3JJL1_LINAN|nr:putative nuclease HARBI1 [Lingula anatina]|eukprot:XP_013410600.1 putative nuclease HARBI1 [Lingula anatina]